MVFPPTKWIRFCFQHFGRSFIGPKSSSIVCPLPLTSRVFESVSVLWSTLFSLIVNACCTRYLFGRSFYENDLLIFARRHQTHQSHTRMEIMKEKKTQNKLLLFGLSGNIAACACLLIHLDLCLLCLSAMLLGPRQCGTS